MQRCKDVKTKLIFIIDKQFDYFINLLNNIIKLPNCQYDK